MKVKLIKDECYPVYGVWDFDSKADLEVKMTRSEYIIFDGVCKSFWELQEWIEKKVEKK